MVRRVGFWLGVGLFCGSLGWWLRSLFLLFSRFYEFSGLDLVVLPLVRLFANPFFWLSLLLLKFCAAEKDIASD